MNDTTESPAKIDPRQAVHSPRRRNAYWLFFQTLMRIGFPAWFGYRAWGQHNAAEQNGALMVANHQSFLDPFLIGLPLDRPVSYLARDNLFRLPVIGHLLRHTYVIPISREAASSASLREAIRRIQAGYLVGIFPEGTRTINGQMQEFKPGFTSLARRAGRPIVPVGIAGAFECFPRGARVIRLGQVRVVYGEPISPETIASFRKDEQLLIDLIFSRVANCQRLAQIWRDTGQIPHA